MAWRGILEVIGERGGPLSLLGLLRTARAIVRRSGLWFVVCGLGVEGGWWRGGGDVRRDPCRHPAASARLRRLGYLILGKQFKRTIYAL